MGNNTDMEKKKDFYKTCKLLPELPGVYLMKDTENHIIYIGKAKNLKNRVSSYFVSDSTHTSKVRKMVGMIDHFDYIVTDTEFEALVLECNLIKKHQPKYNILLKDDKGYSYIKITCESWPRVLYVKQKLNDGSLYIGPYTQSSSVKSTVEEVSKIFKLPTCNRNLERVYRRACLNFYIKRCCAPCIRAISHEDYLNLLKEVEYFLKNGIDETLKKLTQKMMNASSNLDFELAVKIRDKIRAIEKIKNKQKVVAYKISEQDIIALCGNQRKTSIEVFEFKDGNLCEAKNFLLDASENQIHTRTEFVKQYYFEKEFVPKVIILDGKIEDQEMIEKFLESKKGSRVKILIPQRGENFNLVQMCKNNAYENLLKESDFENKYEMCLEDLKNVLNLKSMPRNIEAYDISNLFGSDCVGGMVVFKDGRPFRSGYRKFKLQGVNLKDDYQSIREVIERRINLLKKENGQFPDLILIDGGITHTFAARSVLENLDIKTIPVFGMVKDKNHRTRALTDDSKEIKIKNNSRIFNFITSIQDEVHRYAISYHRNLRNKKVSESELLKIKNIGESRAKILLKTFKSVNRIAQASVEELMAIKGMNYSAAKAVYEYFHDCSIS